METASSTDRLEWAVAQRPLPGQTVSGDRHVVLPHRRGVTLGVIDGVGHGPEAAKAAELAANTLRLVPESNLLTHLHRCHLALAKSRGAVMTLVEFNVRDLTLTLCGVGNVEAVVIHVATGQGTPAQESALLRGGVVGDQLPAPHASVVPLRPGDLLVMSSDGVRTDFSREIPWRSSLQHLADHMLEKYAKDTDDALVLLARLREQTDE
jgi:serine phosphatase RsbU (regulator of sigma subunit)